MLWTRRDERRPKKRKKDEPTPAMRIAALLEEGQAFIPSDVDTGAHPDSTALIRPIYPDSLFEAQAGGQVLAEFVVSTRGEAMMDTFSAVTTTHRELVEPVRRAVREQRFMPAVRAGRIVQQVVQLSLAPAFLLSGIGAIMNVIMSRMIWIAQRVDKIEDKLEDERTPKQMREHGWLMRRRKLAQGAILFSTAAAVMISLVIGLLFISAYITAQIGTLIAMLWVLTMALLVTGLGFFLMETRLAARGADEIGSF